MMISKINLELALLGLPVQELALIKAAVSHTRDFTNPFSVSVEAYKRAMNGALNDVPPEDVLATMNLVANKLLSRRLRYTQKNYHVITSFLIKSQSAPTDDNTLSLSLSDDLIGGLKAYPRDELADLFHVCTSPPLTNISRAYSSKLYLILAECSFNGLALIGYDYLREAFGLDDDSYLLVQNFKRRILNPAIEDIEAATGIKISYTDTISQRKITGFDFLVESTTTSE